MPGDTGTLTVTLKNTNQNSNILQNEGASSGGFATTKSTSIGLFVENVHLRRKRYPCCVARLFPSRVAGAWPVSPGHVSDPSAGDRRDLFP